MLSRVRSPLLLAALANSPSPSSRTLELLMMKPARRIATALLCAATLLGTLSLSLAPQEALACGSNNCAQPDRSGK